MHCGAAGPPPEAPARSARPGSGGGGPHNCPSRSVRRARCALHLISFSHGSCMQVPARQPPAQVVIRLPFTLGGSPTNPPATVTANAQPAASQQTATSSASAYARAGSLGCLSHHHCHVLHCRALAQAFCLRCISFLATIIAQSALLMRWLPRPLPNTYYTHGRLLYQLPFKCCSTQLLTSTHGVI